MPATPKRMGRRPTPGTRFLSQVVADNIATYRQLRTLTQDQVTYAMRDMGHNWTRAALSEVERGGRHVNPDEIASLALILGVGLLDLLDPMGPLRTTALHGDIAVGATGLDAGLLEGDEHWALDPGPAHAWVRGRVYAEVKDGALQVSAYENPRLDPAGEAAVQEALRGMDTTEEK